MIKKLNDDAKGFLTFEQMMENYANVPEPTFVWSGIPEGSMGLIFGPSKTGKTIFCENLAMRLAIGEKSHFGLPLCGEPQKVLFVGLEENWRMRARRNKMQFESLSAEIQLLLNKNYLYQDYEFPQHIITKEHWIHLQAIIEKSKAKVVFIDSITRMNHGKLEDGSTAEEILSNLRQIAQTLNVTILCVHHTPKMEGRMITMDCIKGSAVFAQESDFAIGLNILNKRRYIKDVFFRYAPCNDEKVKEYSINENSWLTHLVDTEESYLLQSTDGRVNNNPRRVIKELINSNSDVTYSTKELIAETMERTELKERRLKELIGELASHDEIQKIGRGKYAAVNYKNEGGNDE